jgi:hypothetical protein
MTSGAVLRPDCRAPMHMHRCAGWPGHLAHGAADSPTAADPPRGLQGTRNFTRSSISLVSVTWGASNNALCALQGALSHFWRVAVGVLGVLVFAFVYTEPSGKPPVRQTAGEVQMRGIPSSGSGASGGGDSHEALAKQL